MDVVQNSVTIPLDMHSAYGLIIATGWHIVYLLPPLAAVQDPGALFLCVQIWPLALCLALSSYKTSVRPSPVRQVRSPLDARGRRTLSFISAYTTFRETNMPF